MTEYPCKRKKIMVKMGGMKTADLHRSNVPWDFDQHLYSGVGALEAWD